MGRWTVSIGLLVIMLALHGASCVESFKRNWNPENPCWRPLRHGNKLNRPPTYSPYWVLTGRDVGVIWRATIAAMDSLGYEIEEKDVASLTIKTKTREHKHKESCEFCDCGPGLSSNQTIIEDILGVPDYEYRSLSHWSHFRVEVRPTQTGSAETLMVAGHFMAERLGEYDPECCVSRGTLEQAILNTVVERLEHVED